MNENKWYLQYESTGQLFLYEGDLKIAQILGGSKEKAIEVANKILAFPEMEKILIRNFVVLGKIVHNMYYDEVTIDGE